MLFHPFSGLILAIETAFTALGAFLSLAGRRLFLALLVALLGRLVIRKFSGFLQRSRLYGTLDPTIRLFMKNFLEVVLYIVLAVSVISILGVPMASVITVLASAGVAIGLSLQGALSNLAGGIMLLLFRPFNVGDYISASGAEGTVRGITLIYTILISPDNKRITVPNGSLMNANVINHSAEASRRIDLRFRLCYGSNIEKVNAILRRIMQENPLVLRDPAFFAGLTESTDHAMVFTARAWVKTENYWTVYSELLEGISGALTAEGFREPRFAVQNG